jgi:hypothetical protein
MMVMRLVDRAKRGQSLKAERPDKQSDGIVHAANAAKRAVARFVKRKDVGVHQVGDQERERDKQPDWTVYYGPTGPRFDTEKREQESDPNPDGRPVWLMCLHDL